MTNARAATPEGKFRLAAEQLDGILHKVVREEPMEFTALEQGIVNLNEESFPYEDMEDILERKQTRKVRFREYSCRDAFTLHQVES